MNTLFLNEQRCKCGKLLLKCIVFDGILEIKCKRCRVVSTIGTTKLVDDATHYLLIIDGNGVIIVASDFAYRILGYTPDEFIGKHFTKIDPTMPIEISKKFFGPKSVLCENNHLKFGITHQTKDGKKIPVTVLVQLYKPTVNERYVLISALLEKSENASEKIISSKNALDFLENSCDFCFELDVNGIVEYISPAVEKLFGFHEADFIGKNYLDQFPVEIRAKRRKRFKYFSSKELPYRLIDENENDGMGKRMHNELYFTPRFSEHGVFIGYRVLGWVIKKPKAKKPKN